MKQKYVRFQMDDILLDIELVKLSITLCEDCEEKEQLQEELEYLYTLI